MRATDEALIAGTLEGDTGAFAQLVQRYHDAAYGIGLHVLGDSSEAAEVAQEAFIRAWRNLDQLKEPARFPNWLCRIAMNVARTRLAARAAVSRTASLEEVGQMPAPDRSAAENAEEAELVHIVRRLVETLPDDQRLAFTLFYVNGYSYNDLSRMLQLAEGTVKTHLNRARARLKRGFVEMARNAMQQDKPDAEFWRTATGSIGGRVTSAATGEPIEGAAIRLYEVQTWTFARTKSGQGGAWEASELLPGEYSIDASHPDYVDQTFRGRVWGSVRTSCVVRPGQTVRDIDFQLKRGCRVSGKVLAPDGSPLAGAAVGVLSKLARPEAEVRYMGVARGDSDGDGCFSIQSLDQGRYLVAAKGGQKRGMVAEGPKTYYPGTLSMHDAEWIDVAPDRPREGVTIRLAATGAAGLRVRARDEASGHRVGGAEVVLFRRDSLDDLFGGLTDENGVFETALLTRGPWQVTAGGCEKGYPRWSKWVDIEPGQDLVEVEFSLLRGAWFEGRVRTEDGSALPDLGQLSCTFVPEQRGESRGTSVCFSWTEKDERGRRGQEYHLDLSEGPQSEWTRADESGRLSPRCVAPGPVGIMSDFADKAWRVVRVSVGGKPLALHERIQCEPAARVDNVEIVIGTNLGVVAGRVICATDGRPAEGVWVRIERRDEKWFYTLPAEADRSGTFHSVPAGPYTIGIARTEGGPADESSRRQITVEPGQVVHLDLVLPED